MKIRSFSSGPRSTTTKYLKPIALAVGLALSLVGCSQGAAEVDPAQPTTGIDIGVALPESIAEAGTLKVGVRCDYPGRGYKDENGDNAGVGPDMARQFAEYAFGDPEKAELTCVTADNRIPYLTSNRVDLLIAALGITAERDEVIDFSNGYYAGAAKILTRADAPELAGIEDLEGEVLLALSGTPYTKFGDKCVPDSTTRNYKGLSDALTDLVNDRGFAILHDGASISELADSNPSVKVNGPDLPFGFSSAVGIRQGESEVSDWVNAAIAKMQEDDKFAEIIDANLTGALKEEAINWIPRPDQSPDYSTFTGEPVC